MKFKANSTVITLVVGGVLCGAIAVMAKRLRVEHVVMPKREAGSVSTPDIEPIPPVDEVTRYGYPTNLDRHLLNDELLEELLDFEPAPTQLATLVDAVETRLRRRDPHLDRALDDPKGTPFRSEKPVLFADVRQSAVAEFESLADEYRDDTQDPPEIAAAVEASLRRALKYMSLWESMPEDVHTPLRDAVEGGGNDPLLLVCDAWGESDPDTWLSTIRKAYAAREQRPLPATVRILISQQLLRAGSRLTAPEFDEVTRTFLDDACDVWQQLVARGDEHGLESLCLHILDHGFSAINAQAKVDLLSEMNRRDSPPIPAWVRHYVAGRILDDAGQRYRGYSYIQDVSPNDLEQFGAFSDSATEQFIRAWVLAPTHAIIAQRLMSLELRAGSTPRRVDAWFRHALAAQFDDQRLFERYEMSTLPKWGGSYDQQIWLAKKYIETNDFDAGVPQRAMLPIDSLWATPEIFERLGEQPDILTIATDLVDSMRTQVEQGGSPEIEGLPLTTLAILLWRSSELERLDWLLSRPAKDEFSFQLRQYGLHKPVLQVIAHQVGVKDSDRWRTIYERLFRDTRSLTLTNVEELEALLGQVGDSSGEPGEFFSASVRFCRMLAGFHRKRLNHETILLSDRDIAMWPSYGDAFTRRFPRQTAEEQDDDEVTVPLEEDLAPEIGVADLTFRASTHYSLFRCPARIDPPYKVGIDIRWIAPKKDPYGVSLIVGPIRGAPSSDGAVGPVLTASNSSKSVIRDQTPNASLAEHARSFPMPATGANNRLELEVFADGYRCFLNEVELETVEQPLNTGGVLHFGRYTYADYQGIRDDETTYRVSNIQIRALTRNSVRDPIGQDRVGQDPDSN